MRSLLVLFLICSAGTTAAVELTGKAIQGGLIFGKTEPGSVILLDDTSISVSEDGHFVIGFGRDETGTRELKVTPPEGEVFRKSMAVHARDYAIERVDGLPPATVTPDPAATARIREDARMVSTARQHRDKQSYYSQGFIWPAKGRISGVYGSQRVLNGEPRRPHFGLDIAAPKGR